MESEREKRKREWAAKSVAEAEERRVRKAVRAALGKAESARSDEESRLLEANSRIAREIRPPHLPPSAPSLPSTPHPLYPPSPVGLPPIRAIPRCAIPIAGGSPGARESLAISKEAREGCSSLDAPNPHPRLAPPNPRSPSSSANPLPRCPIPTGEGPLEQ
ncbi:unnamed protein product [Closterium sp. NIES-64]|nr:unnamed protein product [Closterium sp. NIES-64]